MPNYDASNEEINATIVGKTPAAADTNVNEKKGTGLKRFPTSIDKSDTLDSFAAFRKKVSIET